MSGSLARSLLPWWLREGLKLLLRRTPLDEGGIVLEVFGRSRGTMVDVGAHHGSSLERFAHRSWRVFAFEPDPENRRILSRVVRRLPQVTVDDRAVSDQSHTELPFYRSTESSGLSGLVAFDPSHVPHGTVRTVTLREFCHENGITAIDFLKIDTEGLDLYVLKGVPWESIRPRVVLCEFEDRKSRALGYRFDDLARFLVERGYRVLVSEWYPIERYGVRHRWRRFAEYPCRLASAEAWGNLIATCDPATYQRLTAAAAHHSARAER